MAALSKAKIFIQVTDEVEKRAKQFATRLDPLDALHVASAEEAKADCFCTCDDRLARRIRATMHLKIKVVAPIELAEEIER